MNKELGIRKGFTLIELLIVIAIIGILSVVSMVNYIEIRQKARDSKRKSDLSQIQSALDLFRADNGSYPVSLPGCGMPITGGSAVYLQKMPCDPSDLTEGYEYTTPASIPPCTAAYCLRACIENANDLQKDTVNTCTGDRWSYTVTNP